MFVPFPVLSFTESLLKRWTLYDAFQAPQHALLARPIQQAASDLAPPAEVARNQSWIANALLPFNN
ncbi:hypothetical protein DSO57_1020672 [Entomophthora muscae]|uniref:Uncharacterized protein n=1 Tax=Entomophthora muscae TaxID=34485 RepID=A0ACC2T4J8_9FUNG|nr:hypothetical protein DSO57_1020672 [Entomophthora muscae]